MMTPSVPRIFHMIQIYLSSYNRDLDFVIKFIVCSIINLSSQIQGQFNHETGKENSDRLTSSITS